MRMVSSLPTTLSSSVVIAAALVLAPRAQSFVMPPPVATASSNAADVAAPMAASALSQRSNINLKHRQSASSCTTLFMSSTPTAQCTLSLSLEKPLGLILEETEDGIGGVMVTQVNEGGSAFDSEYAEQLVQAKVTTVMGQDVSALSFDDVMDVIINAPSPMDIQFSSSSFQIEDEAESETPAYEAGAPVTITVQQPETNKPDIALDARVGDNLRKTLLANGEIELYRGLKKKLGNCGGGGQCGFCAVELLDEEGVWGDRSDYEAQRIGKNGSDKCRLACMNNIVGPATVRTL
mmetsp:Transcript_11062/g.23631  ORF Transcript_11062/g.23631 Transcript_11062/m.23631 type:complete len:293 (+) Transcript_11062:121-999(+)